MATLEELAQRLAAVEEQLGMEGGLRASQDRDLSKLANRQTAANHLIQALAITQSDHTERLTRVEEKLDGLVAASQQILSLLTQLIEDRDR